MILLICGSRVIRDPEWVASTLEAFFQTHPQFNKVITGGASGIDRLAGEYCRGQQMRVEDILPDYERHGRRAPLVRDRDMVMIADYVLALWDGHSRGTRYTINQASRLNKQYTIRYYPSDLQVNENIDGYFDSKIN